MGDDSRVNWTLANQFGILRDEKEDMWHSGHVNDILELQDGALLSATETGGVWLINPDRSTMPLSDSWLNPNVNCLAQGPDDIHHLFAGCDGGIIRETDMGEGIPLFSWKPVLNPIPSVAGETLLDVNRIIIIRNLRRIIAACDNGIFWAHIPVTPQKRGCLSFGFKPPPRAPFEWKKAKIKDGSGPEAFWDIAIGSIKKGQTRLQLEDKKLISIVASSHDVPGNNNRGLYVGQWNDNDDLVLHRSVLLNENGTDSSILFTQMGTCSVSSCENFPAILYAACAKPDGTLFQVLRSKDGGNTWGFCRLEVENKVGEVPDLAGDQGADWNNCIAVSPRNPGLVAIGWVQVFLSLDGGNKWRIVEGSRHLHPDYHALRFAYFKPDTIGNLFMGSDGGITRIDLDLYFGLEENPFQSNYNQFLPTMQCYSNLLNGRQFYGSFTASKNTPGLIATGIQDNGNIHCLRNPTVIPWTQIEEGDGGWNAFISDGALLHNVMGAPVTATIDALIGSRVDMSIPIKVPSIPAGFVGPEGDPVSQPNFRNQSGHVMQAVGSVLNQVFGLFLDNANNPRYYWNLLGTLPLANEDISAVTSFSGNIIIIGTAAGKLYTLKPGTGNVPVPGNEISFPKPSNSAKLKNMGAVTRIVTFSDNEAYAILNGVTMTYKKASLTFPQSYSNVEVTSFYIAQYNEQKWDLTAGKGLPGEPMYGFEAIASPPSELPHALLVTTDDRVFISRDNGANWLVASNGLPRNPHCSDLRFVSYNNEAYLYLSTYGRSVWVAKLR